MIHHIYYMRDGKLYSAELVFSVSVEDLLKHTQVIQAAITPHSFLWAPVQPLEIARGMAEHARREAERASREGCMGAIIGERDWGKEAALWMAEARRLEAE